MTKKIHRYKLSIGLFNMLFLFLYSTSAYPAAFEVVDDLWVTDRVGIGTTNPVALLQAGTSPTPGLVVTAAGNTGIGTTDPGAKLEVAGQVKITGGTPGANKVLTSDVNGLATWETAAGSGWTDAGTNVYVTTTTDNVGIGTTNPVALLQAGTSPNPGLVVLAAGNVGIGMTNPTAKLDVVGGAIRTDNQVISTVAGGTAPLAVTSNTKVTNLNADLLDGLDSSGFGDATAANQTTIINDTKYIYTNAIGGAPAANSIAARIDAAISSRLAAASYTAERGTDNAMLASSYVTERGTDNAALASNYTAARAGYLDRLDTTVSSRLAAASYVTERGTDNALTTAINSVQRGTFSWNVGAGGTYNATIASVNTAKSFLSFTGSSHYDFRGRISSATNVEFYSPGGTGGAREVAWEVIEFK